MPAQYALSVHSSNRKILWHSFVYTSEGHIRAYWLRTMDQLFRFAVALHTHGSGTTLMPQFWHSTHAQFWHSTHTKFWHSTHTHIKWGFWTHSGEQEGKKQSEKAPQHLLRSFSLRRRCWGAFSDCFLPSCSPLCQNPHFICVLNWKIYSDDHSSLSNNYIIRSRLLWRDSWRGRSPIKF